MICDVCQQPLPDDVEDPPRTAAGEPAHSDCLEDDTITISEDRAGLWGCMVCGNVMWFGGTGDGRECSNCNATGRLKPVSVGNITPGDVEGVRERLLDDVRLEEATDEYEAGWVDALIAFDLLLTDPAAFYADQDDAQ